MTRTLLDQLREMLCAATGSDAGWAAGIGPHSRLEDDLGLDSLEVARLGELLGARFGPAVDLPGYLAGLELDQLLALTVGDLVGLVAG
ncbi:MAG TPA: acyl carrier protein [Rugosimonospora sp.]|nr:acyl carrier protein [Rugosimonospora sp.]